MTAAADTRQRVGFTQWLAIGLRSLSADVRRRWWLYAALFGIWSLAALRLFVHQVPLLPVMFNWTASLPYRIVYVDFWHGPVQRGDLIVYRFDGDAGRRDYPGLRDQAFFKRVVGMPGDTVSVIDRDVFVNGQFAGRAKTHAFDRRPLQTIEPVVIPPGFLYVQGSGVDSFDSRYRSSGLVAMANVRAKVHPLF